MKRILVFAALVTAVLVVAGPMPATAVEDRLERTPVAVEGDLPADEFVAGEVLVGFRRAADAAGIEAARASLAASTMQVFPAIGARLWRLPPGLAVPEAIRILSANPAVRYAEPNYVVHALALPFDPLRNELYGLHNLGQTGGTADADVDALEAWDVQTGTGTVVVGVIDTGIDYNHEDLVGNIWTNPGEDLDGNGAVDATDFDGLDTDGNGFVDDLRGWDCVNNDNNPIDDNNHGTHVSGTIGGRGNNDVGVVGVNWNVNLMPLKFLNAGGSGSNADAIECVNYAASFVDGGGNKVVRVTSNSWGGGQRSNALRDAIAASGALFVAAAGNSGSSGKMYPAAYPSDNIISVAATDHNDVIASFSNYGSDWVDLGAPGVSIRSTLRGNGYGSMSGTSMATPHVSGAAALVMAEFPSMTNAQVKDRIMTTVDPNPSLQGKTVTGGRLNLALAVGGTPDPGDPTAPAQVVDLAADSANATGSSVPLAWTATGDDGASGTAYLYDVRYRTDGPVTDDNWASSTPATGEPIAHPAGSLETFQVKRLTPETTYFFALNVLDEAGNPSPLSNGASAATKSTGWAIQVVDTVDDVGFYKSLAYDPVGNPAIAYSDYTNDRVKFAHWNGASWDVEVVGADYPGVSLAYSPDGKPSISWGWGKLKFAEKNGPAWTIVTVESANAKNDVTSLAFDPMTGNPAIAYRTISRGGNGDLKLATRVAGVWQKQVVHAGAGARYNSLAYNPMTGYPAIAYSDDIDGDNWLDSIWIARWTGAAWDKQLLETGVVGYGVFASVAFDPTTGYPAVHHGNFVPSRYVRWDGSTWVLELVDAGRRGTLVFDATGAAYIGLTGPEAGASVLKMARRDPSTGAWAAEVADFVGDGWIPSTKLDPAGKPSIAYGYGDGSGTGLKFARRTTVWTSGAGIVLGTGVPQAHVTQGAGEGVAAHGATLSERISGLSWDVPPENVRAPKLRRQM